MKLHSAYSHSFAAGLNREDAVWNAVSSVSGLNGYWIADESLIVQNNAGRVKVWGSALNDGNYLFSNGEEAPTFTTFDSQFNNQNSVSFNSSGTQRLLLKTPINVGTIFIVYNLVEPNGYLIYSPASTGPVNDPATLYYDLFPPGSSSTLWAEDNLSSGLVYRAKSRINGKNIAPTSFVPVNNTRVLSVRDLKGNSIFGFGGQYGAVNGTGNRKETAFNSVRGKIAAIVTFQDELTLEQTIEIETELAEKYSTYTGPVLTRTPSFKSLINQSFSFDFSTIVLDDWFDIVSYALISPSSLSLSFTGSILSGIPSICSDVDLIIEVTNSNLVSKRFIFALEIVRADPLVQSLPVLSNLSFICTASKSQLDSQYYGLYINNNNQIVKWDDARRINQNSKTLIRTSNTSPSIQTDESLLFQYSDSLVSESFISGKTFIWVYKQPSSYGFRQLLNTFPDILGAGQLWTVSNTTQVHGNTPVTRLSTRLNNIIINTFSYKLDLDTVYIITAKSVDETDITYQGFSKMQGQLYAFMSYTSVLNDSQVSSIVAVLADRYIPSLFPRILNQRKEIRTSADVTVDLKTKISDLRGYSLSYVLIQSHRAAVISSTGILSFTGITDESLEFVIDVSNSLGLTTRLTFIVEVVLKTNSLYLAVKEVLSESFSAVYIPELDSYSLTAGKLNIWNDYRNNGKYLTTQSSAIQPESFYQLDNRTAFSFSTTGSDYAVFDSSVTGKGFVIATVRNPSSTGYAFLLGRNTDTAFASGQNNQLFDSSITASSILNTVSYVNGQAVENDHSLTFDILNVVIINSLTDLSVDSIARDRLLIDRSVKGAIAFLLVYPEQITALQSRELNKVIRDYYDSVKTVTLLNFESSLVDSSPRSKTIESSSIVGLYNTSITKFGTASLNANNTRLTIPNQSDFCFLNEDYTVSFWCYVQGQNTGTASLNWLSYAGINIFFNSGVLYIGNTTTPGLTEFEYNYSSEDYSRFNLIQLVRKDKKLYYFFNGRLLLSSTDKNTYTDITSPALVGQTTFISGIFCMDNLVIYRRRALNLSNFTPPAVAYQ